MSTKIVATASVFAWLCLLVGGFSQSAYASHRCEDYGLKPVGSYALGKPVETIVSELRNGGVGKVTGFVQDLLGRNRSIKEVAGLLQRIRDNPSDNLSNVPEPLKGIGGFATTLFLQRLIHVDEAGSFVEDGGNPIAKTVVYGKIRDYYFDKKSMSGHLNVDTCVDDIQTGVRNFYHWDIQIPSDVFAVKVRNDSKPNDPFDLLPFEMPEAALDEENRHSIWYRGLDHKLGAKGPRINVRNVFHRVLNSAIEQEIKRLDNNHRFYDSTEESCVDLFTRGFPPATFGELNGNDYCLGRCAHPAIFNSGD